MYHSNTNYNYCKSSVLPNPQCPMPGVSPNKHSAVYLHTTCINTEIRGSMRNSKIENKKVTNYKWQN